MENDQFLKRRIGITARAVMQLRGMGVAELTRRLGWKEASKTSRLLGGHASWREKDLSRIAAVLGVDVGTLFLPPLEALGVLGVSPEAAQVLLDNVLTAQQREALNPPDAGGKRTTSSYARRAADRRQRVAA